MNNSMRRLTTCNSISVQARAAARVFGRDDQSGAEALILPCRVDREHAGVASGAVHLDKDRTGQIAVVLQQQEPALGSSASGHRRGRCDRLT